MCSGLFFLICVICRFVCHGVCDCVCFVVLFIVFDWLFICFDVGIVLYGLVVVIGWWFVASIMRVFWLSGVLLPVVLLTLLVVCCGAVVLYLL